MAGSDGSSSWRGYSTVNLRAADIEEVLRQVKNGLNTQQFIRRALDDGYKLSLRFEEQSQSYTASLTGTPHSGNAGLTLTAWAKELDLSLAVLYYKHVVLCDGTWPEPGRRYSEHGVG